MRLCGNDGNSGHDGGARGGGRWQEERPEVWWRRGVHGYGGDKGVQGWGDHRGVQGYGRESGI